MKILINHDVFNIVKRLKHINKNYYVLFNKKNEKFELHNKLQKPTLCLVLPFKTLDYRTIIHVLKSEKIDERIKEIEIVNEKQEKHEKQTLIDKTNYQLKEIYDYSNHFATDFYGKGFKFEWI